MWTFRWVGNTFRGLPNPTRLGEEPEVKNSALFENKRRNGHFIKLQKGVSDFRRQVIWHPTETLLQRNLFLYVKSFVW